MYLLRCHSPCTMTPVRIEAMSSMFVVLYMIFICLSGFFFSFLCSVMTPYYSEETVYSKNDLELENEDGVTILFYLQKIFPGLSLSLCAWAHVCMCVCYECGVSVLSRVLVQNVKMRLCHLDSMESRWHGQHETSTNLVAHWFDHKHI